MNVCFCCPLTGLLVCQFDRTVALQRIRDCGGILTSVESVLFELTVEKDAPYFKTVSGLAKAYQAEPSALAHL